MRISDWSSDVCSSDLFRPAVIGVGHRLPLAAGHIIHQQRELGRAAGRPQRLQVGKVLRIERNDMAEAMEIVRSHLPRAVMRYVDPRSEEHTSELQSLMRISYAVFCLKKKHNKTNRYTQRVLHT